MEAQYQLQRFDRRSDGSNVGVPPIPRLKVEYQLSRAVFLRVVGEYDVRAPGRPARRRAHRAAHPDPRRRHRPLRAALGFQRQRLRLDLLFSYQPTPGTVLFAGYGSRLIEPDGPLRRACGATSDGFFLKVSYLFRV